MRRISSLYRSLSRIRSQDDSEVRETYPSRPFVTPIVILVRSSSRLLRATFTRQFEFLIAEKYVPGITAGLVACIFMRVEFNLARGYALMAGQRSSPRRSRPSYARRDVLRSFVHRVITPITLLAIRPAIIISLGRDTLRADSTADFSPSVGF